MMEALAALSLQPCSWIACERPGKAHGGFLKFSKHVGDERKFQKLSLRGASEWDNNAVPRISSCYRKRGGKFMRNPESFSLFVYYIYIYIYFDDLVLDK